MTANAIIMPSDVWEKITAKIDNLERVIMDLNNKGRKEFLTHKEAQQILKCTRNTLDKLANEGHFTRTQTGGKGSKIIFKRSEIEWYINNQNQKKSLFHR